MSDKFLGENILDNIDGIPNWTTRPHVVVKAKIIVYSM